MTQRRTITPHRILTGLALATATAAALLTTTATTAQAAPAEATIRGAGASNTINGQYIVVLKPTTGATIAADPSALTNRNNGTLRHRYTNTINGFSATLTPTAARRLAADPTVAYVEQDRRIALSATQTNPTWGLDRIDQPALPLSGSYTAPSAAGVTAYILDTGVRLTHSEYAGRISSGYDFIDNDANASDCQGHGTHVAATVAGKTYGVAKDAKLVAVRVLDCNGSGTYSQIIAGVDWVTGNAVKPAVANMSLGGTPSDALDTAVRKSIGSGVTYAVAGGNEAADSCTKSPARAGEAITVGATDRTDARASYSNFGTCLDLFAPGSAVLSAANTGDTATTTMSGTSMATPHVAGAVALYLAAHPSATPAQVHTALLDATVPGKVTNAGGGSPNRLLNVTTLGAPPNPTPNPTPTPTPVPAGCAPITNTYVKPIADRATITSRLTSLCPGNAAAASKVTVAINHADRGDLAVYLTAPDGTQYKLKSATSGDNIANLKTTYTVDLATEARAGAWTLTVKDMYIGDRGTLTSWTLAL